MDQGVSAPFEVNLEDQEAFPCLPSSSIKSKDSSEVALPSPDTALPGDLAAEWVVVSPPGTDSPCQGALDLFDAQHPRNMFAKKAKGKSMASEGETEASGLAFDWSKTGLPRSFMKQI